MSVLVFMFLIIGLIQCSNAQNSASKGPPKSKRPTTTTTASPPQPVPVNHFKDGLWTAQERGYNTFFMCTGSGVLVVDAPAAFGNRLIPAITQACQGEVITHVVYSHHHTDHIGAASVYTTATNFICHEAVDEQISESTRPKPACTQTFASSMVLNVGNQTVELDYRGPIHSRGNIFVYAPHQKVLLFIDLITPDFYPFRGLAVSQEVPFFRKGLDFMLQYDFDVLVCGHLYRLADRDDVLLVVEFWDDLKAAVIDATANVDAQAIAASLPGDDPFPRFQAIDDAISNYCAKEMTPKWSKVKKWKGEIFLPSHCSAMRATLRTD